MTPHPLRARILATLENYELDEILTPTVGKTPFQDLLDDLCALIPVPRQEDAVKLLKQVTAWLPCTNENKFIINQTLIDDLMRWATTPPVAKCPTCGRDE